MNTNQHDVTIYVDGACSGNPGPGGWAAILTTTKADGSLYVKELSGSSAATTNNRMELVAIIEAVRALKSPCCINVVTDSANAIGWLSQNWQRRNPEIKELCSTIEILTVSNGHCVCYEKVKGHAGHVYNERCDELAKAAVVAAKAQLAMSTEEHIPVCKWCDREGHETRNCPHNTDNSARYHYNSLEGDWDDVHSASDPTWYKS